jgi:hypothetical protein
MGFSFSNGFVGDRPNIICGGKVRSHPSLPSQPNLYTVNMSESKTLTIKLSAEKSDRL